MTDVKQLITEHLDIWLTAETEKKSGRGRGCGSNGTIYGVKKLRQLIMDLAVQGKLVSMDLDDSEADKFINEIHEHKKLIANQNKKVKIVTSKKINDKDLPFSIPSHWSWARFGDITINRDAERVPLSTTVRETKKGQYNYYGASGVIDHVDNYLFDKTLLLIGEDGANLLSRTTPIAFFATGKYWVNNHAHVIDGISENFLNYIKLFINAIDLSPYVTGTAQPKMNQAKMNDILVALPPPEEQQRIVKKVDELMQLCDQLEQQQTLSSDAHATLVDTLLKALTESSDADEFQSNWQRIVANFDLLFTTEYSIEQLKQTVLQLAVMGKLVKQDPSDEPASDLLKKIADEKTKLIKEGKIKKSKPLPEITEDEKPFELPSGWEWEKLGNISLINSGNAFSSQDFTEEDGLHRVIKITNIGVGEFIESSDYLNIELNKKIEAFQVFQDDLLLALTRPYISTGLKICKCPQSYDKSLLNQRVSMIRPFEIDMNEYIYLFMRSDFVLNLYKKRFSDSGLQPNLKMEDVTNLVIPLPPLIEQKYIIEKVSQLFSIIEQLQVLQSKLQKTKLHLADALVANAVEGG